jgi:quinol monooxygenase YgiN
MRDDRLVLLLSSPAESCVAKLCKVWGNPSFLLARVLNTTEQSTLNPYYEETGAPMLVVTLRIRVVPDMTPHIINLFESYRGPVSVRAGCKSVDLYEHFSMPGDFVLVEEWSSRHALEGHIQSDDFRKVLAIMDLAGERPDLQFRTISSAQGFELVERLRKEIPGLEARPE